MIPFLHWPLVQALLEGVAAVSAATPPEQGIATNPATAALQLLRHSPLVDQKPSVLFFEAKSGAATPPGSAVDRMRGLLAAQLCVEVDDPLPEPERVVAAAQLQSVIERLQRRLAAQGNQAVLGALIRNILVVKAPLFASHPCLLGMVVVGPQPYLDEVDLTTLLLHELVHQAIFLHEMLDPLFRSAARADLPLAYNPLLDAARPIDMCFHAAFVSYVVARVYAESGRPAEAAALLAPLGQCLRVLGEGSNALTPRGNAYLEWLGRRLATDAWLKQALDESAASGGSANRPRSFSALHR